MDSNHVYTIGDKDYSRALLVAIGKERYPKFYLIPRIIGIVFMVISFFMLSGLGITLLILKFAGVFNDSEFPIWVFYIPLGIFGSIGIAGLICFLCSFIKKSEQTYIEYATRYLNKINSLEPEQRLSTRDKETLARYQRLLDGGVISQEEFEKIRDELLNR